MSSRAKRVLYPALAVVLFTFFSFVAHMLVLGTSAFPGGRLVGGRYVVEEHGRVIELTESQYWFSYVHGVVLLAVFVIVGVLVVVYYWRGDLRDEHHVAEPGASPKGGPTERLGNSGAGGGSPSVS
jgi:hypothetical protein